MKENKKRQLVFIKYKRNKKRDQCFFVAMNEIL